MSARTISRALAQTLHRRQARAMSDATHGSKGFAEKIKEEIKETFTTEQPGPSVSRQLHREPFVDRQNELAQKYPDDFSQGARGFEEKPPYNPEKKTLRERASDIKLSLQEMMKPDESRKD